MRHPDWEIKHPTLDTILYKIICQIDRVINFFDHTYMTVWEGMGMFSIGNTGEDRDISSGHLEVYDGYRKDSMPKYAKEPFVRIVTNNEKWSHYTSRYNDCSIPVTISDHPRLMKRYRLRKGDISEERLHQYLRYIAYNKDILLKIWREGTFPNYWNHFKDPERMFDK